MARFSPRAADAIGSWTLPVPYLAVSLDLLVSEALEVGLARAFSRMGLTIVTGSVA